MDDVEQVHRVEATSSLRRLALGVLMGCFEGTALPAWVAQDLADGLGSVCLFGSNLTGDDQQAADLVAQVHAARPDCLVALDEEGGDVTRLDQHVGSRTVGAAVLGAAADVDLTRRVHADLGERLAAVGVDLDLAPVLDVNSAADNPVIGSRSFGADPTDVEHHGTAAVRGLMDAGVAACVKHFPGHGDTRQDSHVQAPVLDVPLELLRARELLPFAAAVAAGAEALMTAHVRVPALDPDHPASTSARTTSLLRDELGFDGVVVTDALDMAGVSGPQAHGSVEAAAVASLTAGADLLCLGADWDRDRVHRVVDAVVRAVGDGRLEQERLVEAAGRVSALGHRARQRRERRSPTRRTPQAEAAARAAVTTAAWTATRVSGQVPPVAGAVVVRLVDRANAAVGEVPWGLLGPLQERVDGVTGCDALPSSDPAAVLAGGAGRPLVVVCRDSHRSPDVRRWLAAVLRHRPDTVLVDLGWPAEATPVPPAGALVRAHGAGPASAAAVADLLAGPGAAPRPR
ncbi:glycoside hydrolase family 3 N-terminal domain-containing protein [Aquipuribacter sp. MA13-6]|uniref:glycoside hydrolase family 3 N-terminal domain-containing protein n=1 Tax=unclassified Aquipuribacter TaxID=2635084 RepID=UPI003EEA05BF